MKAILIIPLIISMITIHSCKESKVTSDSIEKKEIHESAKDNGVYIKTKHAKGKEDIESIDSTYSFENQKYFEVDLAQLADKSKGYIAKKTLVSSEVGEPFEFKFFEIVDDKKQTLYFKNSTSFLNFMDNNGYKLKEQKKSKYNYEYLFEMK